MSASRIPPHPDNPLIQSVWLERPYLPRAIAALVYLLEVEAVVGDLLDASEREFAAAALADSHKVRAEFSACYGLDADIARAAFQQVTNFCLENPSMRRGEGAVYAPSVRMFYRLGYTDGLLGFALEGPTENVTLADLQGPTAETEEEQEAADAVQLRVDRVFYPAYERGWRHGNAARLLAETAPRFVDEVRRRVRQTLRERGKARRKIRLLRHGLTAELAPVIRQAVAGGADPALLARFAAGESAEARRAVARRLVTRRIERQQPLTQVAALTEAARLTRRLRYERQFPSEVIDSVLVASLEEERREVFLRLAAWGFGRDAVDQTCRARPTMKEAAFRIAASADRDGDAARTSRALIRALGRKLPQGLLAAAWTATPFRFARSSAIGGRRVIACPGPAAVQEMRVLEKELALPDAADGAAALLLARSCPALGGADAAIGTGAADCFRAAERETTAPAASWEGRFRSELAAIRAGKAGEAFLADFDPSDLARARAESEIALDGRLSEAEAAEAWVHGYRREALSLDDDEALSLLAQARIVEAALDERAARDVRRLLDEALAAPEPDTYLSHAFPSFLGRAARVAAARIRGTALNLRNEAPRYTDRLIRHIGPAVLDRVAHEMATADGVRQAEAAG